MAVLALVAVSGALLIAVKTPGPLRTLMGGVVDGVERRSQGDLYFPIAVATLFWLAHRSDPVTGKLLFCVPVLLLTLGDSAAALVGIRFGRHTFTAGDGTKSVEGSLACFAVAYLCTALPLLAFSRLGHAQALVLAAVVGLSAALIEAVSWGGLDNLFLPLGAYALLQANLPAGPRGATNLGILITQLAVAVVLTALTALWKRRTALNDHAAPGACHNEESRRPNRVSLAIRARARQLPGPLTLSHWK